MEDDVLLMVGTVADVTYQTSLCLKAVLLQQFTAASPCLPLLSLARLLASHLWLFVFQDSPCSHNIHFIHLYGYDPKLQLVKAKQCCPPCWKIPKL